MSPRRIDFWRPLSGWNYNINLKLCLPWNLNNEHHSQGPSATDEQPVKDHHLSKTLILTQSSVSQENGPFMTIFWRRLSGDLNNKHAEPSLPKGHQMVIMKASSQCISTSWKRPQHKHGEYSPVSQMNCHFKIAKLLLTQRSPYLERPDKWTCRVSSPVSLTEEKPFKTIS